MQVNEVNERRVRYEYRYAPYAHLVGGIVEEFVRVAVSELIRQALCLSILHDSDGVDDAY